MIEPALQAAAQDFEKTLKHLQEEFSRLQVGRANPSLVEHLMVEAYGGQQPIKNLASINVPEARSLSIQPWDKSVLGAIEKAILISGLGLNPINNGAALLINIPSLTEERRKELVKIVHTLAEEARISIRGARQNAHGAFKTMQQNKQITEDEATGAEKKLQEKVDEYNKKVADMAKAKEEAVMTV